MRDLYILRHGEAANGPRGTLDHDRALTLMGVESAQKQGQQVAPALHQKMLVSTALRTQQTAAALLDVWKTQPDTPLPEVVHEPRGYLASADTWMDLLSWTDDAVKGLWLVGHNPGVSALVTLLTGEYVGMATADLVHLTLEIDAWSEVRMSCGQVSAYHPGRGA